MSTNTEPSDGDLEMNGSGSAAVKDTTMDSALDGEAAESHPPAAHAEEEGDEGWAAGGGFDD